MARIQIFDLPTDETLDADALKRVRGGALVDYKIGTDHKAGTINFGLGSANALKFTGDAFSLKIDSQKSPGGLNFLK